MLQDWAKFDTGMIDNPDFALLTDRDYKIFTWLILLCRRQGITDGRMVGWNCERIAFRFRMPIEDVTQGVTRMSRADVHLLCTDENNNICIPKYEFWQYGSESATPQAARERKRRQRNKQKQDKSETDEEGHGAVTDESRDSHGIEEKRGEEKRGEEGQKPDGAGAPPANSSSPTQPPEQKSKTRKTRDEALRVDLTKGGKTLIECYEKAAASQGKKNKFEYYANAQQRSAFEAVYAELNGELAKLIDKGFARNRASVSDMLAWLEGCVRNKKSGTDKHDPESPNPNPRIPPTDWS